MSLMQKLTDLRAEKFGPIEAIANMPWPALQGTAACSVEGNPLGAPADAISNAVSNAASGGHDADR